MALPAPLRPPRALQERPKRRPRGPQEAHKVVKDGPRRLPESLGKPKTPSKMADDCATCLKMAPTMFQDVPRLLQNDSNRLAPDIATCLKMVPKMFQDAPRPSQDDSKWPYELSRIPFPLAYLLFLLRHPPPPLSPFSTSLQYFP